MEKGKLNMVVDGQWGSCGKGLIASYLAKTYAITHASTNNLPNAGHTAVFNEHKFVSKILPIGSFLNKFGLKVKTYIGPGAGFNLDRLFEEMFICNVDESLLRIHPRAMVVTDKHKNREVKDTKHVASTMQGSGAARAEKIMRSKSTKLARDYPELNSLIEEDWVTNVHHELEKSVWLHEGSQGFSLGINHGSHYPYCTSRECSSSRELTDMGINPRLLGDVYLTIRPYPIRVGNVVENGNVVGYSGGCYADQKELTWDFIKESAGYPNDYDLCEITTVTKRIRRVFTFSMGQVKKAILVNGANKIALNFANYLDYKCYGTSGTKKSELPMAVATFIDYLEDATNVPVALVGTGPCIEHVWQLC